MPEVTEQGTEVADVAQLSVAMKVLEARPGSHDHWHCPAQQAEGTAGAPRFFQQGDGFFSP